MKQSIIPKDSALHLWLKSMSALETPRSYLTLVCLSAVGCLLRRNVWVDQEKWKIYPNLSIFLVGPSGIGKDTAIDRGVELVRRFNGSVVYGRTVEQQAMQLVELGDPACALVPGPEATAFFGRKDYQQGKLEFWTDLLSNKDEYDFSSRKDGKLKILRPTITMMLGSTVEWLHRNMPDGALEGGFFPRFVVLYEKECTQQVPWIKLYGSAEERRKRASAHNRFLKVLDSLLLDVQHGLEMTPRQDAIDFYTNWYYNRFNYFPEGVREYANRSRDHVLRIGMLSALLRQHRYIDAEDLKFAHELFIYSARTLEDAIKPQSVERQAQAAYTDYLKHHGPTPRFKVIAAMRKRFDLVPLLNAEKQLIAARVVVQKDGRLHLNEEKETPL